MYHQHKDGVVYISQTGVVEFYSKAHRCRSRPNGPAYIHNRGTVAFYDRSAFHRTTGPAIIFIRGEKEYWINDQQLSVEEFFSMFGTT